MSYLWGLFPDKAAFSRFLRGLLLALLTNLIDQASSGIGLSWRTLTLTLGSFLVGWLRAGEPNQTEALK